MAQITFGPLAEIDPKLLLNMLLDPDVRRHMPLAGDNWDERTAGDWAKSKDAQWQENGFGPWAIKLDGKFAGWGGFQKEDEEVDLGLVLLPQHWGQGAAIFRMLVERGREMGLTNVTIMLPPSRLRLNGLARLGFTPMADVEYAGKRFHKFRLD